MSWGAALTRAEMTRGQQGPAGEDGGRGGQDRRTELKPHLTMQLPGAGPRGRASSNGSANRAARARGSVTEEHEREFSCKEGASRRGKCLET